MAGITAIREALAEQLQAIADVQASARILANPTPPTVYVLPDQIDYDQAMGRGLDDVHLLVQALVGTPSDLGAQLRLDQLLEPAGETSVKAAVEADPTLDGLIDDLHVESCSGYRVYPLPDGRQFLGAEWRILVLAGGAG